MTENLLVWGADYAVVLSEL